MSIFDHRKPVTERAHHDPLFMLRESLKKLELMEAEPEDSPRIADLKRILASRIAELERKTA